MFIVLFYVILFCSAPLSSTVSGVIQVSDCDCDCDLKFSYWCLIT